MGYREVLSTSPRLRPGCWRWCRRSPGGKGHRTQCDLSIFSFLNLLTLRAFRLERESHATVLLSLIASDVGYRAPRRHQPILGLSGLFSAPKKHASTGTRGTSRPTWWPRDCCAVEGAMSSAYRVRGGTQSLYSRTKYPRRRLSELGVVTLSFSGHPCRLLAQSKMHRSCAFATLREADPSGRKLPQRSPGRLNLEQ